MPFLSSLNCGGDSSSMVAKRFASYSLPVEGLVNSVLSTLPSLLVSNRATNRSYSSMNESPFTSLYPAFVAAWYSGRLFTLMRLSNALWFLIEAPFTRLVPRR